MSTVVVQPEADSLCVLIHKVCGVAHVLHEALQTGMIAYVPQLLSVADFEKLVSQVDQFLLLSIELVQQSGDSQDALVLLDSSLLEDLGEVLVSSHSDRNVVAVLLTSLPAGFNDDVVGEVDLVMILDVHLGREVPVGGGNLWWVAILGCKIRVVRRVLQVLRHALRLAKGRLWL